MSLSGIMNSFLRSSRRVFSTVAQSATDMSITWASLERQYVSYKLFVGLAGATVVLNQWATESQIVKAKAEFQQEVNNISLGVGQINNTLAKLSTDIDTRFQKMEDNIDTRFKALETDIDTRFKALETDIDTRFKKMSSDIDQKFKTVECDISALRVDIRSR